MCVSVCVREREQIYTDLKQKYKWNRKKNKKQKTCTLCCLYLINNLPHKWHITELKAFISSVQFSCSVVSDSVTPWTTAHQASLSITNSQSSPKPMSIESVMPSNHLILCCPPLVLPSIFSNNRVFSNESALHMGRKKKRIPFWSIQQKYYFLL